MKVKNTKKKSLLKLSVVFALLLTLTGCIKTEITADVKSPEDITINSKMMISTQMFQDENSEMTEEEWLSDAEQETNEDFENVKTERVKETIDDIEYVGVVVSGEIKKDKTSKYVKVNDGKLTFTYSIEDFSSSTEDFESEEMNTESMDKESIAMLKQSGMSMKLTVKMPGKVTYANYGKIEGNTVVVDMLEESVNMKDTENVVVECEYDDKTIVGGDINNDSAVTENEDFINDGEQAAQNQENSNKIMLIIIVVICVILFGAVVALFYYLWKKNEDNSATNYQQDFQNFQRPDFQRPEMDANNMRNQNRFDDRPREDAKDTQRKVRFCPNCGQPLHEGDEVCRYCGRKIWK